CPNPLKVCWFPGGKNDMSLAGPQIERGVESCYWNPSMARLLELTLNGRPRVDGVKDNLLLLDYLREVVGLTGTKTGCDGGECGACTVLVDDEPRLSCLTLAAAVA